MITNISLVTVWVTDQDAARDFYVEKLGFTPGSDVMLGEGFRWVTVVHPEQPELQATLMLPGPPLDEEMATAISRALAGGRMGGLGLSTDDCRAEYERLTALGVEFVQEPSDRPYGVEAVLRDNSGNWLVLVEPKEFRPEDFG